MSYRIAVLINPLIPYDAVYAARPGLADQPYALQKQALLSLPPSELFHFSRHLAAQGADAQSFFITAHPLHRAWAREKGIATDWQGPDLQFSTAMLVGQLAEFRPDVILVHSLRWAQEELLTSIRESIPSIRLIAAFEGGPIRHGTFRDIDLLFVCVPAQVEQARALGAEAHLLYHSFDTGLVDEFGAPDPSAPRYDFTFTGASGYGTGPIHSTRYWALTELMLRTDLRIWAQELMIYNGVDALLEETQREQVAVARGILAGSPPHQAVEEVRRRFERERLGPPFPMAMLFPDRCAPAVYGAAMFDVLRRSRVTFNFHTMFAQGSVGNARLFEATGVGTCLLTDRGSNLSQLFEPDREVVVYGSLDEAVEKLDYLLDHEDERLAIARAGQARTHRSHSFAQRCAELDATIRSRL